MIQKKQLEILNDVQGKVTGKENSINRLDEIKKQLNYVLQK